MLKSQRRESLEMQEVNFEETCYVQSSSRDVNNMSGFVLHNITDGEKSWVTFDAV